MIENKYDMTNEQFVAFCDLFRECDPVDLLALLGELWLEGDSKRSLEEKRADANMAWLLQNLSEFAGILYNYVP
jgi:hypothetical protein